AAAVLGAAFRRATRLVLVFFAPVLVLAPIFRLLFGTDFFFRGRCGAVLLLAFFRLGFCLRLEIMDRCRHAIKDREGRDEPGHEDRYQPRVASASQPKTPNTRGFRSRL